VHALLNCCWEEKEGQGIVFGCEIVVKNFTDVQELVVLANKQFKILKLDKELERRTEQNRTGMYLA
jgi:hypothetical protein